MVCPGRFFDFDGYMGMVQYGPLMHFILTEKRERPAGPRGWGLVIQAEKKEFYLVGDNVQLYLRPKPTVKMQPPLLNGDWKNTSHWVLLSVWKKAISTTKVNTWRNAAATATR
jgi:hypothetical protein